MTSIDSQRSHRKHQKFHCALSQKHQVSETYPYMIPFAMYLGFREFIMPYRFADEIGCIQRVQFIIVRNGDRVLLPIWNINGIVHFSLSPKGVNISRMFLSGNIMFKSPVIILSFRNDVNEYCPEQCSGQCYVMLLIRSLIQTPRQTYWLLRQLARVSEDLS